MTEEEVFHAALAKPTADRAAFLDQVCSGNAQLRESVEALLAAHEAPGSFLKPQDANRSANNLAATLDSGAAEGEDAATGESRPSSGVVRDAHLSQSVTADYRRDAIAGAIIGGRYTLQEKIGEGGMGEVWAAKQTEPVKRKVALKLIKTGMDSRVVLQRFEQERQALALMDHPNIARVLDGGMTPTGQPFFVMELVNGQPLNNFCDEMKLTLKTRLELFVPVCQAVQHAHQKGIVHRDLKPANILVTMIDGKPVPKVIDFGVAKATSGKLTEETMSTGFGAVVGTLEYMSPEQAGFSNVDIDTRADIYSLGVILYELLTGLRPIDAKRLKKAALSEMIRMIQEDEPSKPSTRLSTDESLPSLAAVRQIEPKKLTALLRGELDWVVMKCLEKQRDRRYETANALARDVQRYLADEAVEARPPSWSYRMQKSLRRNKGKVAAAGAVAASLGIGLVAFAWQAQVARDQRDRAIRAQTSEKDQRKKAEMARDAEAAALEQADLALNESRETTARMTYEQAQEYCQSGEADLGVLWMARSLELTPLGAMDLERAIRTSMNLWAQQLNTVRRYELPVYNVRETAVSPDGLSLLVADDNGVARVYETSTGKLRFELPIEANSPASMEPTQGVFSPDGRFIAIARNEPQTRVWNVVTGKPVGEPLIHQEPVTSVSFDPKGSILVTNAGKTIHFWNIEKGVEEWNPITLEQDNQGVEISSDGSLMLTWSKSPGQVTIWDYKSRNRLHSLDGIDFDVQYAGFSPDSKWVLAGCRVRTDLAGRQGDAQFWDALTGKPVGNRMRWLYRPFSSEFFGRASFHPEGRVVVTGGSPLRLWQVPSGKPVGAVSSMSSCERPLFLPDGKRLLQFPYAGTTKQWIDLPPKLDPYLLVTEFGEGDIGLANTQNVDDNGLVVARDGRTTIVTFTQVKDSRQFAFFRLFELSTGKLIGGSFEEEGYDVENGWIPEPSFSSDGRNVAFVVAKNGCRICDTETGRERIPCIVMDSRIMAVAFSPDGQLLATGDREGNARLWNTTTGQPVGPPMVHQRAILRICFSPDGRKLLLGAGLNSSGRGDARLWDVASGQPLGPELAFYGAVRSAAFSPDGKTFATGSFQLTLWDAATSKMIWSASSKGITDRLAFTPDGQMILARHVEDGSARIYDASTGNPKTPYLRHLSQIHSTALSPDGKLVLTSSDDQTTRLWDATLGLPLGPGWSNSNGGRAAFSADGSSVLLIDEPNRLVRWDLPPPLEGTPERISLAVEAGTMHYFDTYGTIQSLSPVLQIDPATMRLKPGSDPFEPVAKRLQELGGPPGNFNR